MNREDLEIMAQEEQTRQQGYRCRLLCCASTPCLSAGAATVVKALQDAIHAERLNAEVQVVSTGCMGPCSRGPMVTVTMPGQEDVIYERVTPASAWEIVEKHVMKGKAVAAHVLPNDLPFFARQSRIVLANCGRINPERVEEYVARGGYKALAHVLREMTPDEVCEEITASGLRGRGGAGYPAGLKWQLVRKAPASKKYVVANCDEGDPGAYMDRTLLESDPQRLLEGMAIAGYATGADQGYIFVRGGYPGADERLQHVERAIRAAEQNGLLGMRILDSGFNFRVDLRIGAGAFVCGEETALMGSIMGRRGQPVPRPPYPAQSGLWDKPTLINNVETLCNVVPIITMGAEAYANIGTERSKGTKVFALAGRCNITGLVEVPMGTPLREIIYDIGGGIQGDRQFKAVQTGGPSGGCIPAQHLDVPVEYESFKALGSIMGSGGMVVMDEQSCMVDVARFFMEFCMDESCGKCIPCRVGTTQMFRILERFTQGSATEQDLENLEGLCELLRETSLCGLGQSAPNPVLSTLRYFRGEYEAHLRDRQCPANVCQLMDVPVWELVEELPRRIQAAQVMEVA